MGFVQVVNTRITTSFPGSLQWRPGNEVDLHHSTYASCVRFLDFDQVSYCFFSTGVTSSLWSQESIDWLRKTVGGKQLQAYPTKTNDLIIVDLYAPSKSPKQKHQSVVKGLPSLHYSITEMMINASMAQRIVPAIANNENSMSTTSSNPLSVTNKDSLTQNVSSVSIESKIEEETCSKNDKKAGDCAGTGNLISSTDTVVQCPTIGSENWVLCLKITHC